ncbi:unannotated protein [freshwater metagenome]|uniref:Unannotated protein n=1 Tax=freshwater metagenome TaxID=449393 RepID=A0A6J7IJ26_9ZZZZ
MLGPPGRADVQVHVAGLQAQPVHRGQVAQGVADLGVLDQLGPRRRPGGEVQQQRVTRRGPRVFDGGVVHLVGGGVGQPALDRVADGDAGVVPGHAGELGRVHGVGDHVRRPAALDPVDQVGRAQRGGGRHDDRAELHHRQHRLPQLDLVAQHQHHPVAPADPDRGQPAGHLVRPPDHLGEGVPRLAAVGLGDPQRGALVVAGVGVEPVVRPVEPVAQVGPAELGDRARVLTPQRQQLVPGSPVVLGGRGRHAAPPR